MGTLAVVALAKMLGSVVPRSRKARRLLYDVSSTSPVALGTACVVLIAVATLAGLAPARQATRVDPLIVLRTD